MGKTELINVKYNATVNYIETNQLKYELSAYSVPSGPRLCETGTEKKMVKIISFLSSLFSKLLSDSVS